MHNVRIKILSLIFHKDELYIRWISFWQILSGFNICNCLYQYLIFLQIYFVANVYLTHRFILLCLTITIVKMFQRVSVWIPVHFIYLNWQQTACGLSNRLSRSISGNKGTAKSADCLIYICVQSLTIYQQLNFQYHSIKQSGLIYNHYYYCRWPSIYTI